jgi:hypothetical protein
MRKQNQIRDTAWKYYSKWRKTQSYSPALKAKIKISLKGWRHISGATGNKKRALSDITRRFKLLPKAKEIIETSTTIQNVTKKGKRTFYALEAMVMVEENNKKALRKVRVILIEDIRGNKIFYSVMDKKQKNRGK